MYITEKNRNYQSINDLTQERLIILYRRIVKMLKAIISILILFYKRVLEMLFVWVLWFLKYLN